MAQWLALAATTVSLPASELSMLLSPLVSPDFESARRTITNLEELASRQSGNAMVRTERLATVVRNLFTAEFRLEQALAGVAEAKSRAAKLDRNAKEWLRPNAFGRINETAAKNARNEAEQIRRQAARDLSDARAKLRAEAREVEVVMRNFHDLGDLQLVLRLGETVIAVTERSLDKAGYQGTYPNSALTRIKQHIAKSATWRAAAVRAEKDRILEDAVRYYSLAGDSSAARRCAEAMAPELIEAGIYGSAIEALEFAGRSEQAAQLRREHPILATAAFRRLAADELDWRIHSACVGIRCGEARGAGFFFHPAGFILARYEAADGAETVVRLHDHRQIRATVIARSETEGLAMLRVPLKARQVLGFANDKEISAGLKLHAWNPATAKAAPAVSDVRIVAQPQPGAGRPPILLKFNSASPPAGAPLVDDRGRILGILTPATGGPRTVIAPAVARAFIIANRGDGSSFQ